MGDVNLLYDIFNLYYEKAKKAQATGNVELAKRNYFLAAETLLKIAKESTAALQKEQVNRAHRIIKIAEDLEGGNKPKVGVKKPPADENGKAQEGDKEPDEDLQRWQAAKIPDIHFSDIAGLDDVKRTITTKMINPIKYPDKYAAYGKKTGGGVLLFGPPGTGKTMIAKAIACEVGAKFYAVKGSDIVSKWVGDSEKNINLLFETARADNLAIIFIDEMDGLFRRRGEDIHNDKRVNEFLQQMDGFIGRSSTILLLGATNRPWDIDDAAMRSGRFSQKIYVTLPDAPARKFLFNKFLSNAPLDEDIDVDYLVKASEGLSGADIEEVVDRAKEEPLYQYIASDKLVKIKQADIVKALNSVQSTVSDKELKRFDLYANVKKYAAPTDTVN